MCVSKLNKLVFNQYLMFHVINIWPKNSNVSLGEGNNVLREHAIGKKPPARFLVHRNPDKKHCVFFTWPYVNIKLFFNSETLAAEFSLWYLTIIRRRRSEYWWIFPETKSRGIFTNIHEPEVNNCFSIITQVIIEIPKQRNVTILPQFAIVDKSS